MTTEPQETEINDEYVAEPVDFDIPDELPTLSTTPVVENAPVNLTIIRYSTAGDNWDFYPPSPELQRTIQQELRKKGIYPGSENGIWGNLTVFSIKKAVGLFGSEPNREVCIAIQDYAAELGEYERENAVDGFLSEEAWEGFVLGLQSANTP